MPVPSVDETSPPSSVAPTSIITMRLERFVVCYVDDVTRCSVL